MGKSLREKWKKSFFRKALVVNALRNEKASWKEKVCLFEKTCHNVVIENWERWKPKRQIKHLREVVPPTITMKTKTPNQGL